MYPVRVNEIDLPKERMIRDRIRTPTAKNLHHLESCKLPPCYTHTCLNRWAFWYVKHLHAKTLYFLKGQFPGKQVSFLNSFKVHMLSYWSSKRHAKLTHLDFINKKPLGYLNLSHQTQHPLCRTRWFQVTGIPRKGGQCLTVIYSNIVALNTRLFTKYVRRHLSKKINTKQLPDKLFGCLWEP